MRGRDDNRCVGFPTKNTVLTSTIITIPERAWTVSITTATAPRT